MKYVEGYHLHELIQATDRVGDERALRLLGQVAGALDAAHGLELVHRDVKPANVLIGAGDEEHAHLWDRDAGGAAGFIPAEAQRAKSRLPPKSLKVRSTFSETR